jgi:carboxylate-amine ligase
MPWLPLFLALSTSSPFWNHRVTGLLSYRQALYDEWPRSGIPDFFLDEADYQAFVDRMQAAGAIADSTHLWWAIRPALRYPTLELRISDVCTRLQDALAIATLYRCLIATLIANPEMGKVRSTHTRRLIDENRWRAKRDGIKAEFIFETSNEVVPIAQVVTDLLSECREQIDRLNGAAALDPLHRILDEGTSAHQQLKIYNDSRAAGDENPEALGKVIEWLKETTLAPAG